MLHAFDLDKTLLTVNISFEFCRHLYRKNILSFGDRIYCYLQYFFYIFKHQDLKILHQKIFKCCFYNQKLSLIENEVEKFLTANLDKFLCNAVIQRLQTCQKIEQQTMLLSNSPDFIVYPIARKLGFNYYFATQYRADEQGNLANVDYVCDGIAKRNIVTKISKELGISLNNVIAYSDSHFDLPLLKCVGKAIAVRPSKKLFRIARKNQWEIL